MEGRYRYERRYNPENPFGRGIETRGNAGPEDHPERENLSWLSEWISTDFIERARQYPLCEGWSNERIILEKLLGVLVETGPELNPQTRKRFRNLVGVFRIAAFPNMNDQDQDFLKRWSESTTFDARLLQYEVDLDATEDVRWIWNTFNLQVPNTSEYKNFPPEIEQIYPQL